MESIIKRTHKIVTSNSSFTGWADVNNSNYDISFNTTGLTNEVTGACWDINNDGIWDAYAGYVGCFDPTIEDGGDYTSINGTAFSDGPCPNATINYSANWYTHYNITRNDTNVTTIKVKVFDKCGGTIVNSTQIGYWERGSSLLCYNGVKDNENNELIGSGSTSISDYGGTCGLCTDGILNNDETSTNYGGTGFDYGGKWCGVCDATASVDDIWITVVKENGLSVPLDTELCREVEGTITLAAIFMIIIMIILLLLLVVVLIVILIPMFAGGTKVTVAMIGLFRRIKAIAKKKKAIQRLAKILRKKRR